MSSTDFIFSYVQDCASGKLAFSDRGPIWQLGIIAALLGLAIVCLVALRFRPRGQHAAD